jgi:hypothetical protein
MAAVTSGAQLNQRRVVLYSQLKTAFFYSDSFLSCFTTEKVPHLEMDLSS